jgi:hypothetical protein
VGSGDVKDKMTGGGNGRMPPPAEPHRVPTPNAPPRSSNNNAMASFMPTPHRWLGRRLRICKVSEHGQRRYVNACIVFHDPSGEAALLVVDNTNW